MDKTGHRVLIVDDERWNLEVLEAHLQGTGYVITRAAGGEDALKAVADAPPDIVLLDIMMPGMDGLEVCRRLKGDEKTRFLPVVMVTSLDQREDRLAAIEAGADDFITKPVDKAELLARTKSLLRLKSLHDELEERYREVVETQILKENLMQMLVHDFKNPLTGIMGYLELIGDQTTTGNCEGCAQYALNSRYLARKMSSMVNDLLDLSRLEKDMLPLRIEDVYLRDVFDDNMREFAHGLSDKGIRASLAQDVEKVHVNADRTLITRVVGNMLANAIRHSPEKGGILCRIGAGGGTASFSISDEGPGIPEGAIGMVFEKFYQVEAKASDMRSGAGLGLAFCELVVKAHGGHIKVANNPGRGCTFTITLPAL